MGGLQLLIVVPAFWFIWRGNLKISSWDPISQLPAGLVGECCLVNQVAYTWPRNYAAEAVFVR